MGGYGSGQRLGRNTTADMRPLDVRRLHRDGLLTPGQSFAWQWTSRGVETASIHIHPEAGRVILSYGIRSRDGERQAMEYPVYLEWTSCHLGGQRVWFRCPAQGCGRRVAILFGGSIFACRHCHRLAYESQREFADDRAIRRADAIRRRLGWVPGALNGEGWKPKGMHWRTFRRLRAEHDAQVNASLFGVARRLKLRIPGLY